MSLFLIRILFTLSDDKLAAEDLILNRNPGNTAGILQQAPQVQCGILVYSFFSLFPSVHYLSWGGHSATAIAAQCSQPWYSTRIQVMLSSSAPYTSECLQMASDRFNETANAEILALSFHSAHVFPYRGAWGEECPGSWLLPLVAGQFHHPHLCPALLFPRGRQLRSDHDGCALSTARNIWRSTLTFLSNCLTTRLKGTWRSACCSVQFYSWKPLH